MAKNIGQTFGSIFAAEMKRIVFKPKRLIVGTIFVVATILLLVGMTAGFDWTANAISQQAAESGDTTAALEAMPAFLGFSIPLGLISFCFGIYAAVFVARDFNDGTVMATLLCVPNRLRLFTARLLPWVVFSFVFSLIAFAVIAIYGVSRAGTNQLGIIALQGLIAAFSTVCTTVVGYCCGSITKKGSLSVLLFLALFFLIPTVVGMAAGFGPEIVQKIISGVQEALPGNAFSKLLEIVPVSSATTETWISLGISFAWIIGTPVLSYILFDKRATLRR